MSEIALILFELGFRIESTEIPKSQKWLIVKTDERKKAGMFVGNQWEKNVKLTETDRIIKNWRKLTLQDRKRKIQKGTVAYIALLGSL